MRKMLALMVTIACSLLLTWLLWQTQPALTEHEIKSPRSQPDFVAFSMDQMSAHAIQLYAAAPGTLKQIVRAPAKIALSSDLLVHVIPKANGVALKAFKNLGEHVEQGEVLARIESREMAEVKSEYLCALNKCKLVSNTFAREQKLSEKQLCTLQEFYQAENEVQGALIELELTRQKLYAMGLKQEEIEKLPFSDLQLLRIYDVRSPLSGQIIQRQIFPGEFIDQQHEIYTIADLSTVWAEISVFAKEREGVKKGQTLEIVAHDGQRGVGKVLYLSPILNQETYRSDLIAELENSAYQWLPGTFAEAELVTTETTAALAIPKTSVHQIDHRPSLFVAQGEGFVVCPVSIGRSDEKYVEVLSGVQMGELIAAENSFLLKAELQKTEAEHMD